MWKTKRYGKSLEREPAALGGVSVEREHPGVAPASTVNGRLFANKADRKAGRTTAKLQMIRKGSYLPALPIREAGRERR